MTRAGRWAGAALAVVALTASLAAAPPLVDGAPRRPGAATTVSAPVTVGLPLSGVRIALDAGHQLGNHNFPAQIRRLVPAGGFEKPCNTTGTATNGGYPEATLNFRIVRKVQARLQALGAEVLLSRTRNSESLWGPCVDVRGEFGARVHAQLTVSLHADGARSDAHGFHVIAPVARSPWTTDIAVSSRALAEALRAGFDATGIPRSTYVGGGTALSIRSDLATLNLSDVPVAMLEIGNMRNASDAHRMTTRKGRALYARAVVRGIQLYLDR
ncbi:N-acetylmuramoyl-L-alanine amidase [Marmoricola sp. URHA0025 HA25]